MIKIVRVLLGRHKRDLGEDVGSLRPRLRRKDPIGNYGAPFLFSSIFAKIGAMKKTVLLLSLCGIILTLLPGTAGTAEKKAQLAKKYEQGLNDEVNDLIAKEEKKAAEINVESADILNFLGSVYIEDGRKGKARETFAESLKIKSDQPLVTSVIERIDK